MKTFKDYYGSYDSKFEPFGRRGFTSIEVLSFLKGHPWNDIALAYIHALFPSAIRVTNGDVTADAYLWRVTVTINEKGVIEEISQEVQVGLPEGIANGHELDCALKSGKGLE